MKRRDIRNLSTPDSRAFWAHAERVSDQVKRAEASAGLPLACADCGAPLATWIRRIVPGCDCAQWRPPFAGPPRVRWAGASETGGEGGGG